MDSFVMTHISYTEHSNVLSTNALSSASVYSLINSEGSLQITTSNNTKSKKQ
jgi:hypothetical protein